MTKVGEKGVSVMQKSRDRKLEMDHTNLACTARCDCLLTRVSSWLHPWTPRSTRICSCVWSKQECGPHWAHSPSLYQKVFPFLPSSVHIANHRSGAKPSTHCCRRPHLLIEKKTRGKNEFAVSQGVFETTRRSARFLGNERGKKLHGIDSVLT